MAVTLLATGEKLLHIQRVAQFFDGAIPHCQEIGLAFVELGDGYCLAKLPFNPDLVSNPASGAMHIGAVVALIDTAAGAAAITSLSTLVPTGTLDLRVDYLADAEPGKMMWARAETIQVNHEIVFSKAIAYHDSPDRPLALGMGTFMIQQLHGKRG